ncbi:hypothetical protein, partial [Halostella sp. PRR32]|uniref:hypothetical protein n=1 Tax=Halostella sp. PRR32 TaxID=3098147 RepID=UPI002B1CF257
SKVETKKLLHPKTTTAAGKSLKLGQRPRNQAEAKEPPFSDEKVGEEKTLHMIDKKQDESKSNTDLLIQSPSPLSPESLNSSSQTTTLSFTS